MKKLRYKRIKIKIDWLKFQEILQTWTEVAKDIDIYSLLAILPKLERQRRQQKKSAL